MEGATKVADKVYDKVGNFGGGYTPQGPGPATLLHRLQTLRLLGSWVLQTRYKVLQAATTCGIFKASDRQSDLNLA